MGTLSFYVAGIPVGKGSMKAFYVPKINRCVVTNDSSKSKPWASTISVEAAAAVTGSDWQCVQAGGMDVRLTFNMPRPQGHYGSGKNKGVLKLSSPSAHVTKPDIDKLTRLTLDALKGIVWNDDSQVVDLQAFKNYAIGTSYGVRVEVRAR